MTILQAIDDALQNPRLFTAIETLEACRAEIQRLAKIEEAARIAQSKVGFCTTLTGYDAEKNPVYESRAIFNGREDAPAFEALFYALYPERAPTNAATTDDEEDLNSTMQPR